MRTLVGMRTALLPLCLAAVAGCGKTPAATREPAPSASASTVAPVVSASVSAAPLNPYAAVKKAATLADALALAKPKMADSTETPSEGAIMLALWGEDHLLWADVAPKMDETSIPLVRKDSESERAKRMCVRGSIISIQKDGTIFTGLLALPGQHVAAFFALRSTGDLVERHEARFCGFVTGNFSYKNTGGGTTHAVHMVGMFDLPENRIAK